LRRAGYEVVFPPEQTCCGQPFFNSGFVEEARRLARRTVDIFADFETVVLPSGSCATMLRAEYAHLLQEEPEYAERARQLASHTYELSEFLVHVAKWPGEIAADQTGTSAGRQVITYHDSCHMRRQLQLSQEPRQLLQQAGYELQEMVEPDRCCGFGGLFSLRMADVSNAMTAEKVKQAADAGAALLATADPGCLMQIRGLASEEGVEAEHLALLLERATR